MIDPFPDYGAYEFIPYAASNPTCTSPAAAAPSFKIKHTSTWTYCGALLSPPHLPSSLHTWSNAAISFPPAFHQRLLPLLTFLHTFLSSAGIQHYWLSLRATTPTMEYDTPRWHVDDDFFAAASGSDRSEKKSSNGGWKLSTVLLGPSTLFLPLSLNAPALSTLRSVQKDEAAHHPHACTSLRCAGCSDTSAAVRATLSQLFASAAVVRARRGEVAFFRTGAARGAMHSEPRCDADRVFVNVVPGTEEELRALMGRFGMGFPRAWSLGVGMEVRDGLDGLGGGGVGDDGDSIGREQVVEA